MIAVSYSLPARKRQKAVITEMNAKEAASSPVPAVAEDKGCEMDEEFVEERWRNESSI